MKENQEIQLSEMISAIWTARIRILLFMVLFTLFGVVFAFISPVKFRAQSKFIVQGSGMNGFGSNLGGLASLAGLGSNRLGGDYHIPPALYPEIVQSTAFKLELINYELFVDDEGKSVTYKQYYEQYYKQSALEVLSAYTLGLPTKLKSMVSSSKTTKGSSSKKGYANRVPSGEAIFLSRISNQVNIKASQEGVVDLYVEMPTGDLAARLAQNAFDLLQEKIVEMKIQHAREKLEFTNRLYEEKKKSLDSIYLKLAEFNDSNLALSSERAKLELKRLQNQFDLNFSVYTEVANQLESAKLKVQEDSPIFSIIDPVFVPSDRSSPRRTFLVLLFAFLGLFISSTIIVLALVVQRFRDSLQIN